MAWKSSVMKTTDMTLRADEPVKAGMLWLASLVPMKPSQPARHCPALLTDLYEMTMAYGYWKCGVQEKEGGFSVAFGLGDVIDFLHPLAFHYGVEASALDAIQVGGHTHVIADAFRGVNLQPGDAARALGEIRVTGVEITDSRFTTERMRRDAAEVSHGR